MNTAASAMIFGTCELLFIVFNYGFYLISFDGRIVILLILSVFSTDKVIVFWIQSLYSDGYRSIFLESRDLYIICPTPLPNSIGTISSDCYLYMVFYVYSDDPIFSLMLIVLPLARPYFDAIIIGFSFDYFLFSSLLFGSVLRRC